MVPQQQPSRQAQRWIAAYQRAMAEGLIPVYVDGQVYKVKGYDVVVLGARWDDLACTCPAGAHGRICKHQAVVAKSRALHIRCHPRTTPAPAAQASTLVAGVAPQLADCFN